MSWSWSLPQSTRYVMLFSERVNELTQDLPWSYVVVVVVASVDSLRDAIQRTRERVDSGLAVVVCRGRGRCLSRLVT